MSKIYILRKEKNGVEGSQYRIYLNNFKKFGGVWGSINHKKNHVLEMCIFLGGGGGINLNILDFFSHF